MDLLTLDEPYILSFVRAAQVSILSLSAVLATGLGCSSNKSDFPLPMADAVAESVTSETRPFEIGSDKYNADFGTITVPENRSKPTSRLISLPFLRIRASAVTPAEPIFALAGGPGMTNMAWDWEKARIFLSDHDFVLVGYRGVDGSTVLDCPAVADAFKTEGDPLGEESIRRIGQAWDASARRLTSQGVDLDGYTMLETIDDNESIRKALRYEQINLLSESYGTRVAYLYGLRYPQSIHRSAMIAVNPPGRFVWDPEIIDKQLRQYAVLWSRDSMMSMRSPDLYRSISEVLSHMPPRWLFVPIDPGRVRVATFGLLSHRNTAAMVFDAYVAAEHGDPSGLALMSLAYNFVIPSLGTWGDLASKAFSADFDSSRDYCRDAELPGLPLGSPMNALSWGPFMYCHWPTRRLPEEFRKPRLSHVETLLLSGNLDFSTPAEHATMDLLPFLPCGRQVILSECGHVNDVWQAHPENTHLLLTAFFRTGVPNLSLNSNVPMDFSVAWGFPRIAKVATGIIALLILALAALVFFLVRRYRRLSRDRLTGLPGQ